MDKKKSELHFGHNSECLSHYINPLEAEKQRREEIRRIILEKKGGYWSDTDIEICLVYCLTSLI
jgi:hypothetical protein